jgi:type VI secretion system protein ImpA
MSSFDLESLLRPISADEPSGPDLEYDPDVAELNQLVKGKPEQQFGNTIIEAEEPDWKSAQKLASGLLQRTKDLRIAVHLANSVIASGQLRGFRDVMQLIAGYLTEFWGSVHPALDHDDDDDPTERVNAIAALRDPATTVRFLKLAPLLKVPGVAPITMLSIEVARGDVAIPDGEEPAVSLTTIDGAFQGCDLGQLTELATVVEQIKQSLDTIESTVTTQVGVSRAVSLDRLVDVVKEIESFVRGHLKKRQGESTPAAATVESPSSMAGAAVSTPAITVVATGEVRTRDDVIQAIDRICEYYEKFEPSSPLPLLLGRARRLVTASFMQIIQDLTPDAIQQAEQIGGGRSSG